MFVSLKLLEDKLSFDPPSTHSAPPLAVNGTVPDLVRLPLDYVSRAYRTVGCVQSHIDFAINLKRFDPRVAGDPNNLEGLFVLLAINNNELLSPRQLFLAKTYLNCSSPTFPTPK